LQTRLNLKARAPFSEARGSSGGAMVWVRQAVAALIACQEQRYVRWFLSLHIGNAEEKFRHRSGYAERSGSCHMIFHVQ
jgi:hypothetical protein